MKTIVAIIIVVLLGIGGYMLWWLNTGEDNGEMATSTELTQLKDPDADAPAAPVCSFQDGENVVFSIQDGIPSPRCAFAMSDQRLAFTNNTEAALAFNFAGADFNIAQGETDRIEERVGSYLAPGVHRVAMDFYAGSGPEVWVTPPTVTRIEGTISEQFVSARAIVVETNGGQTFNLGLDEETQMVNATNTPIMLESFSLALVPGARVVAIVDVESEDTAKALTIRVLP